MTVFGYDDGSHGGHAEIRFTDVRVPASNIISGPGEGFAIAQARLGPGRIHHCMRLIGMAERALELMCRRSLARVAFGKPIAEQGVVGEWIAESRVRIEQARLLVLKTAWLMDTVGNKGAHTEIQAIKIDTPLMTEWVIDKAIQAHGAGGVSQDFPLAQAVGRPPVRCVSPTVRTRCTAARSPARSCANMPADEPDEPAAHRPAGRLGRRADDERVRVVRGVLRAGGSGSRRRTQAFRADPIAPRAAGRARRSARCAEAEFEKRFARPARCRGRRSDRAADDRTRAADTAMMAAVRRARHHGIVTGLISNSWGVDRYDPDTLAELFDGVVISGDGRHPQAGAGDLRDGCRARSICRRPTASTSTTCPAT